MSIIRGLFFKKPKETEDVNENQWRTEAMSEITKNAKIKIETLENQKKL